MRAPFLRRLCELLHREHFAAQRASAAAAPEFGGCLPDDALEDERIGLVDLDDPDGLAAHHFDLSPYIEPKSQLREE
jgi:hypothetical protein